MEKKNIEPVTAVPLYVDVEPAPAEFDIGVESVRGNGRGDDHVCPFIGAAEDKVTPPAADHQQSEVGVSS